MTLSNCLILTTVTGMVMMTSLWVPVSSHGRLWEPPARGTMWRRHYDTPKNYNDNEMFCGGFLHQVSLGYKCGVCGDAYDLPSPRPHEAGGLYATGTITANYVQGQQVTLQVEITANHKGWFEFKICRTSNYTQTATQECFDQYVLQMADGSGTRLNVSDYGETMVDINVTLPGDLTCDFCTIQWRYHAGNNWGEDPDGTECIGCGNQEEFYGCADVKISSLGTTRNVSGKTKESQTSTAGETPTITAGSTTSPDPPVSEICKGIPGGGPDLDDWCNVNCNHNPRYCPSSLCQCQIVVKKESTVLSTTPVGTSSTAPSGITSKAPVGTTSTAPARSTSTAPARSTSTAPARSIRTAPDRSTSTAPDRSTSTAPDRSTAPVETTSTVPVEITSTAPARPTSTTPAVTTNTAPVETTNTAQVETTSTAPARSTSTAPIGNISIAPVGNTSIATAGTTRSTKAPGASVPQILSCNGIPDTGGVVIWCNHNCNYLPNPNCPAAYCQCQQIAEPRFDDVPAPGCYAKTPYLIWSSFWDVWCQSSYDTGNCPENECFEKK